MSMGPEVSQSEPSHWIFVAVGILGEILLIPKVVVRLLPCRLGAAGSRPATVRVEFGCQRSRHKERKRDGERQVSDDFHLRWVHPWAFSYARQYFPFLVGFLPLENERVCP